jgi:hypothetical protein
MPAEKDPIPPTCLHCDATHEHLRLIEHVVIESKIMRFASSGEPIRNEDDITDISNDSTQEHRNYIRCAACDAEYKVVSQRIMQPVLQLVVRGSKG